MLKYTLLFVSLIVEFASCNYRNTSNYRDLVIGDWTYVGEEELYKIQDIEAFIREPYHKYNKSGFIFKNNDSCENKVGYFSEVGENLDDIIVMDLGSKTRYKIENDTLKIYDLSNKIWEAEKIFNITEDTLTFQINERRIAKYAKEHFKDDKKILFDQCIVSSSGCYGNCPINDILINRNGEILYFGREFNTKNGYFKSKISETEFSKIENCFKQANILKLNDSYRANGSDYERITMSWIKDNKIIKSISDYGQASPASLQWAYSPLRFMYQHINMDTISTIPKYLNHPYFWFEQGNTICDISKSESFYLRSLLLKSKKVNLKVNPKYIIKFWENDKKKEIVTDGRFYQFSINKKEKITLDLEFNFLERNNLFNKFRLKKEYE